MRVPRVPVREHRVRERGLLLRRRPGERSHPPHVDHRVGRPCPDLPPPFAHEEDPGIRLVRRADVVAHLVLRDLELLALLGGRFRRLQPDRLLVARSNAVDRPQEVLDVVQAGDLVGDGPRPIASQAREQRLPALIPVQLAVRGLGPHLLVRDSLDHAQDLRYEAAELGVDPLAREHALCELGLVGRGVARLGALGVELLADRPRQLGPGVVVGEDRRHARLRPQLELARPLDRAEHVALHVGLELRVLARRWLEVAHPPFQDRVERIQVDLRSEQERRGGGELRLRHLEVGHERESVLLRVPAVDLRRVEVRRPEAQPGVVVELPVARRIVAGVRRHLDPALQHRAAGPGPGREGAERAVPDRALEAGGAVDCRCRLSARSPRCGGSAATLSTRSPHLDATLPEEGPAIKQVCPLVQRGVARRRARVSPCSVSPEYAAPASGLLAGRSSVVSVRSSPGSPPPPPPTIANTAATYTIDATIPVTTLTRVSVR
jgi:hypothetical protein